MILALLLPTAQAATLSVGPAAPYTTIGAALRAASNGDTIEVAPGTYAEAVDLGGRSVTLRSTGGSASTFLAPSTTADALTIDGRETATVQGFTITPSGGRGVVVSASTATLEDVVVSGAGALGARGGGLFVDGGDVALASVTFTGGTATYGGHLHATGGATVDGSDVVFTGGTATYGGAVWVDDGAEVTLASVVATGPSATREGGFAYVDGGTLAVTTLVLDAPQSARGGGGFRVTGHGALTLADATVSRAATTSSGYGGAAVFADDGATLELTDAAFSDAAASVAGALDLDNVAVALLRATFADNVATGDAGAVRVRGGARLTAEDCTFTGNLAGGDGGAALVATGSSWDEVGGTWQDNAADGGGGALATEGTATLTVDGSAFAGNVAGAAGGAARGEGTSAIALSDATFSANEAETGDGGAVYAFGPLTLVDAAFDDNVATLGSGGAVAALDDVTADGARFEGNVADDDGGAVRIAGGDASLREAMFFRNRAGAYGGGLAVDGAATLAVARAYLHGNAAAYGGGLAVDGAAAATLSNLRVTDNAATDGGGAWLAGTVQVGVVNATFAGNDASSRGGHLYTTAPVSLINTILAWAIDGGGAWGLTDVGSDRYYNLAWDNAGGDWVGWSDPTGTSGNLDADPGLVAYTADGDETDDDLSLEPASPCLDAGSPAYSDVDGSRSDIGAFGGPDADVADGDGDGWFDHVDCDDGDASINPGEPEVAYDGLDQDCDGVDLDDLDGDGFGVSALGGSDCDDADADVFPGAADAWYDGVDADCAGDSDFDMDGDRHDAVFSGGDDCDDADPTIYGTSAETWYDGVDGDCDGRSDFDRDRDGHDSATWGGDDCDDFNAARFPGNVEWPYDDVDQDCSGADTVDVDGDGWVATEANGTDCNDAEAAVHPGAFEDPDDGFDTDCDGVWEWDVDGDGWLAQTYGGADCDDTDPAVNPGVEEVWYDGEDQDCDGRDDDKDGDGWLVANDCDDADPAVHPEADERVNGVDDDCDGWAEDSDRDADGLTDLEEGTWGTDPADPDTDKDGLRDGTEIDAGPDRDDDGAWDALDIDDDGDGIATIVEQGYDVDGDGAHDEDVDDDGVINAWDLDSDGDDATDRDEGTEDDDRDGVPDFLDYQGDLVGGGCGGASWSAVLLPFATLLRRRRVLATVAAGMVVAGPALAVDASGFSMGATTGDPTAYTRLGSPEVGGKGAWDAGVVFSYADTPLAEELPWGREPILASLATANVVGAYTLGGLRIEAAVPVHLFGEDAAGPFTAMGDAKLGATVPLLRRSGWRPAVALHAAAWAPTGTDARWLGGGPRLLAGAQVAQELGPVGLVAMAGAMAAMPEETRNLSTGIGPAAGLGVAYRVSDTFSTALEVTTATELGFAAPPVEATVAGRMRLPAGGWATVGGAAGLSDGVGAARWRAFAGVGFSFRGPEEPAVVYVAAEVDPTADRDGDGFPDVADKCPDNPETVDGFTDDDGCPELDGDGDGVPFERDLCPREPIHPEQDPRYSDGCPKVAELAGDRIVITETIFFAEGRAELLPSSARVLDAVAAVMVAHPEIPFFLVEGHTNGNGSDAYNLRLSDARAYSVMRYLGAAGVTSERLVSKGFGEARPLVPEGDPIAEKVNRRVEFRILRVEEIPADARRIELPPEVR